MCYEKNGGFSWFYFFLVEVNLMCFGDIKLNFNFIKSQLVKLKRRRGYLVDKLDDVQNMLDENQLNLFLWK